MATISLCMIAKNESHCVANCLESISDIVDEIIVVDTGSTDNTKEICKKYTENVYDFEWVIDFSKARNYSFSKATGDWIIWLDCDDVFLEEDRNKFKELKKTLDTTDADIFSFWYNFRHDSKGNCVYRFLRQRLIRNFKGYHWDYPVHEALIVDGKCIDTDINVTHTSNHDNCNRYVDFFERKIKEQNYELRKRDMYYYGGELYMSGQIDKAQRVLENFFVGVEHDNRYEAKRAVEYLIDIYNQKGMHIEALDYELKYLKYTYPDPKIFAKIGGTLKILGRYEEAIFYYKAAVKMENDFPKESYVVHDYRNVIFDSALELVCLLYRYNKHNEAREYHNICKKINPKHESVIYNEAFFEQKY